MALASNKLPPRYAVADWHTSNNLMRTNAERLRNASHSVRQDARRLRNETENHTRWTQHDSNTKLEKRIDDINEWREALNRCLADTNEEIKALQVDKEKTERALDAKKLPLDIAIECLMLRENRIGIDLVRDEVEEQLHKEVEVIEGIKALLQQKINEGFEQLCLLQEASHQTHCDITDKDSAVEIDDHCAQLNNESEDISLQINPTRTMKGIVTPETWDAHSQYNKLRAEAEMKASERLREAIFATLEKTKNDLAAQKRATDFAYRKRIHETQQAHNELEWQQRNTKEEIATMEQDIEALKESIDAKLAPMKVAQTRLENRTYRPNVELCRDIPQYQLCYEVGEIDGSIKALIEQLQTAESALQNLQMDLARIETDLAIKTKSLALDNECMNKRTRLIDAVLQGEIDAVEDGDQLDMNADAEKMYPDTDVIDYDGTNAVESQHINGFMKKSSIAKDSGRYKMNDTRSSPTSHRQQKDLLETTYNTSYETGRTNLRSGDLARTLGRSASQRNSIEAGRQKDVLFN